MLTSSEERRNFTGTTNKTTRALIDTNKIIRPSLVNGRRVDGLSELTQIDGSCKTVSDTIGQEAIGDIVLIPSGNFSQTGSSSGGFSIFAGNEGSVWMREQEPVCMEIGSTTSVEYFGFGFSEDMIIEYLLPTMWWKDQSIEEVHPNIEVTNLVIINELTATADVIIDSGIEWPKVGEEKCGILAPVKVTFP